MSIDSKMLGVAGTAAAGLLKEVRSNKNEKNESAQGASFLDALQKKTEAGKAEGVKIDTAPVKPLLKFSNHALDRMNTRGISFTPEQITKIEQGMQKATGKGAKETLVLTDNSALIVSLKDSMVVTVMDKAMLKENVFTNIDSTVFV